VTTSRRAVSSPILVFNRTQTRLGTVAGMTTAFWLRWVAATAVGVVVAFAGFVAIFMVIGEPSDVLFPVLMAAVGLCFGAFQQRCLGRALSSANGWAVATGLGLGVGIAVDLALGLEEQTELAAHVVTGAQAGAVGGAVIGVLQARVLQRHVSRYRWWVAASIIGWAAGAAGGDAVGYFADGLDIVVGPVVAAAVTGVALVALLRSNSASLEIGPTAAPAPGAGTTVSRSRLTTNHRRTTVAIIATTMAVAASIAPGDDSEAVTSAPPPTADGVHPDELAAAIQGIVDASIAPGAIAWDCCGLDLPPTGVVVGVRVTGRPDIVLASGTDLDGAPLDPTASFSTSSLGHSIVAQLGLELVADGTLDPDATVDAWLPDSPNATTVTIRMLIDGTHGWADFGDVQFEQVTADFARHWTAGEALATLHDVAPAAEPGTFVVDGIETGLLALGYIAEQVTGHSLADLVTTYVTGPAGLEHSFLSDGTDLPDDYLYGRFALADRPDFAVHATDEVPLTSYFTYAPAEDAFVSTVADLLDLLDTWVEGTWRPGGTPPDSADFPADRQDPQGYPGDRVDYVGLEVPYNGYCPCHPTGDGNTVDAIGRQPQTVGNDLQMLHFLDDDVSIVLHYNSNQSVDRNALESVLDDIRATVAASL
jgi:CubicO group peptidase (beta-lactamase class C family)